MEAGGRRSAWSSRRNLLLVLDQSLLEDDVVDPSKPRLDTAGGEDKEANYDMAVRPYAAVFRGTDRQEDAQTGSHDCHGVDEELSDNVEFQKTDAGEVQPEKYRA